jgi:hypothetical protein
VYVCDYAAVNFNIYASQNAFKDQVIWFLLKEWWRF